jgi:hypothetical protein
MTEFEKVLQECLLALESGNLSMEECLRRYPRHAMQLEPVLWTSLYLEYGREARPSPAFKARVRARLVEGMRAHPRKSSRFNFIFLRTAASLAVLALVMLAAGTAYAQSAAPGHPFYAWKLTSERAWRAVSPDPVGTDLAIAERRVDELVSVAGHPDQRAQVLNAYLEVVARLESGMDAENMARVQMALDSQMGELNRSGIFLPQLDPELTPALDEPAVNPGVTPQTILESPPVDPSEVVPTSTPIRILETPGVSPTDLPNIVPTIPAPEIQVPTLLP